MRLLYTTRSKCMQSLEYRCMYISKEGCDDLNIAINDMKEKTGGSEKRQIDEDRPNLRDLKSLIFYLTVHILGASISDIVSEIRL